MKKLLLLTKTLLVAALLMVGANAWGENMTTMTGRLGLADNSGNFGAYATKLVTIGAGESYEYTFINYNDGASEDQIYHNWFAEIRNTSNSHCGDVRADGHHWVWPDANNDGTLTDNYTGDNSTTISSDVAVWAQAYNGVTVTVTVTRSNDGNTVTVTHSATTNAVSEVASRTYSGTYTCSGFGTNEVSVILANEKSHQKITKVVYTKADGGSIFVAPDHTAGAKWGARYDGTYESTVDAAAEFYNNDGAGDGWFGCAYAKFTYSELPNSSYTITDATLTYNTNQGGNNARDDKIYHMNAGFDLDWANFAGQKATDLRNTSNRGSSITVNTGAKGIRTNLTGSVTSFIQTIATSQKYILFQWTGNAGGANLYGNGATDYNAPELAITYSTVTVYTATFTETNSLNPTVTIYSDAGRTSTVTNGSLTDGTTYYYRAVLAGYNNYEGSFTVDGADPDVNFTMTAKAVYSYTVRTSLGATITSGSDYEGSSISYKFPHYQLSGTDLYVKAKNNSNPWYGNTFTLSSNEQVETVTYSDASVANVVYLVEAEDLLTATSSGNADIRCSKGQGGYATEKVEAATLAPGKYKITGAVWGNGAETLKVYDGGENTYWSLETNGNWTETTSEEFTLNETTTLYVLGGNSSKCLDYFYIQKTGDIVKLNSDGYATYSAGYDVEVSGAKAYTAMLDFEKKIISCTEIASNKVPAGKGVLLYGDANADVTLSITTGAAALGDNNLKATTLADGSLATKGSNNYYALSGDTFKQFTGDAFVHNKAYFEVEGESVLARSMSIVLDGNITGVANVEAAAEAKAKEGKFIENGKLVIVKNGVKYNAAGAKLY